MIYSNKRIILFVLTICVIALSSVKAQEAAASVGRTRKTMKASKASKACKAKSEELITLTVVSQIRTKVTIGVQFDFSPYFEDTGDFNEAFRVMVEDLCTAECEAAECVSSVSSETDKLCVESSKSAGFDLAGGGTYWQDVTRLCTESTETSICAIPELVDVDELSNKLTNDFRSSFRKKFTSGIEGGRDGAEGEIIGRLIEMSVEPKPSPP